MMVLSQDRTLLVDVEGVMIDPEFSGNIVSTSTDPVSGFRYFLASYDDEKTAKQIFFIILCPH